MDTKLHHPAVHPQRTTRPAAVLDAPAPAAPVPLPPTSLVVGDARDHAEADADRMADAALRRLAGEGTTGAGALARPPLPGPGQLRRTGAASSVAVVGRDGGALDRHTTAAIESRRGRGRPLDRPVLERMQAAFSADFSRVRVHDDAGSSRLNRLVSARAFTTGSDIFFGSGEYAPATPRGERVLAHELAHTLQGRSSARAPGLARTIRRAGDKIAFEKAPPSSLGDDDQQLVGLVDQAIAAHKEGKAREKDRIEKVKDDDIDAVNAQGLDKEDARNARAAVLKTWHTAYRSTGWNLANLRAEILRATSNRVAFDDRDPNRIAVTGVTSGLRLYTILKGAARFGAATGGGRVVIKKGTQKEYVQDARGVFVSRYVHRGCSIEQMRQLFTKKVMLPRNQSDRIGTQGVRFDFGSRTTQGQITDQERDFLQQRDGSGDNQRMLSVTHTKPTRKVHSNHGELFGSEAIIKVDLSRVRPEDTFNLHSPETHATKTALPQRRPDEREPSGYRTVPKERELASYVYSAEKNRETALLRIPVAAVVAVRLPGGTEMSLQAADKLYNEHFDAEERARREEEERRVAAREKSETRKARAATEEERADAVKSAVEDLAAEHPSLSKWKDVSLHTVLMKVKSTAWLEPVAGVEPGDITWQQAKKVLQKVDELTKNR